MPDITMCTNTVCPIKNKCKRSQAEPSEYNQSYSFFNHTYLSAWGATCNHFINIDHKFKEGKE